jgi:hypothetical protein
MYSEQESFRSYSYNNGLLQKLSTSEEPTWKAYAYVGDNIKMDHQEVG